MNNIRDEDWNVNFYVTKFTTKNSLKFLERHGFAAFFCVDVIENWLQNAS